RSARHGSALQNSNHDIAALCGRQGHKAISCCQRRPHYRWRLRMPDPTREHEYREEAKRLALGGNRISRPRRGPRHGPADLSPAGAPPPTIAAAFVAGFGVCGIIAWGVYSRTKGADKQPAVRRLPSPQAVDVQTVPLSPDRPIDPKLAAAMKWVL